MTKIPIEVSARHIHLAQQDLEKLFGEGYQLKTLKYLTQPSDFAAQETIDIQFGSKTIPDVRIVGPAREATQVELSKTDAIDLGIDAPVKMSGDLLGSSAVILVGPQARVELAEGVIVSLRHIHCNSEEAKTLNLQDGITVSVKVEGEKAITFHNVKVRVRDDYKLCMHVDTDEGNAAGINRAGFGEIITNI